MQVGNGMNIICALHHITILHHFCCKISSLSMHCIGTLLPDRKWHFWTNCCMHNESYSGPGGPRDFSFRKLHLYHRYSDSDSIAKLQRSWSGQMFTCDTMNQWREKSSKWFSCQNGWDIKHFISKYRASAMFPRSWSACMFLLLLYDVYHCSNPTCLVQGISQSVANTFSMHIHIFHLNIKGLNHVTFYPHRSPQHSRVPYTYCTRPAQACKVASWRQY